MFNLIHLKFDTASVIALFAFLVACLSALYARYQWCEVRKANAINLLTHKKAISDAFFVLKMHMIHNARFADMAEVSKFFNHQKDAKIFFPKSVSEDIEKYYDACFRIADIYRRDGGLSTENSAEAQPYVDTEKWLSNTIEKEIGKSLQRVRNE